MIRIIGGVVAGYVVMAFLVFVTFTLVYMAIGPDMAFRAGVYEVSMLWIIISIVVGLAAAVAGGWVSRRVARTETGPRALAVIVVLLGLAIAVPAMNDETDGEVREAAVDPFEAMQVARTPLWLMFLNPLIGAAGVLIGGNMAGARREDVVS